MTTACTASLNARTGNFDKQSHTNLAGADTFDGRSLTVKYRVTGRHPVTCFASVASNLSYGLSSRNTAATRYYGDDGFVFSRGCLMQLRYLTQTAGE